MSLHNCSLCQCFPDGSAFARKETFAMFADIFYCHDWELLLASRRWKPEMLQSFLQCLGHFCSTKHCPFQNVSRAEVEKPWPVKFMFQWRNEWSTAEHWVVRRCLGEFWHLRCLVKFHNVNINNSICNLNNQNIPHHHIRCITYYSLLSCQFYYFFFKIFYFWVLSIPNIRLELTTLT